MLARENTIYTLEWDQSIIRNTNFAKTYTLQTLEHLPIYNDGTQVCQAHHQQQQHG